MTNTRLGTFGRVMLGYFLPVGIALAVFIFATKLFRPQPSITAGLNVAFTIFVLGYSLFMGRSEARRLDEVQRAGAGFANSNGWVWGGFATLFLLAVPPVINGVVDLVMKLPPVGPTNTRLGVRLGLTFGAALVMVMQALAIIVASIIWGRRMRGSAK
jgi:hypothetical protein